MTIHVLCVNFKIQHIQILNLIEFFVKFWLLSNMTCCRRNLSQVVAFIDLTFPCLWGSFSFGTLVICRRKTFFTEWISFFQDQTSSFYITDGMHLHQNLIRWSWWVRTYLFLIAIQIWNQKMSKMEPKHGIGVAFHFTCPLHIVVWQGNKRMHIYNCCWKKRVCIFPAWIILLYIHSRGVGLI